MRIIPDNHHFKPFLDPAKRKLSAAKEKEISKENEKYHDRLEITNHTNNDSGQSSKIVDDRYQRYSGMDGSNGKDKPVYSLRPLDDNYTVPGKSSLEDEGKSIQGKNDSNDSLLQSIGFTDERIEEIRKQISEGMYESVVVQQTVADMITRDLLKE